VRLSAPELDAELAQIGCIRFDWRKALRRGARVSRNRGGWRPSRVTRRRYRLGQDANGDSISDSQGDSSGFFGKLRGNRKPHFFQQHAQQPAFLLAFEKLLGLKVA
jgi:hypothetical protein